MTTQKTLYEGPVYRNAFGLFRDIWILRDDGPEIYEVKAEPDPIVITSPRRIAMMREGR